MAGSRGIDWIKSAYNRTKNALKRIQWQNSTGKSETRQSLQTNIRTGFQSYRYRFMKVIGVAGAFAAITYGGNYYVQANMVEVYHVSIDGEEIGVVSDPKLVDNYITDKLKQEQSENPNIHMALNVDHATYSSERAFMAKPDDEAALEELEDKLVAKAVGVELKIDGKVIAILKDEEAANQMLEQIKSKYVPAAKDGSQVRALAMGVESANVPSGSVTLESAGFVQNVEVTPVDTSPEQIADADQLQNKLETGDIQPIKYKVQEGECVSCIADKFDISTDVIYNNNPQVKNDMIFPGQELDLTVLQPMLTVRTVEKLIEDQEIQFDTVYEKDDSLQAGITKVVKPGKNGLKKVTYQLTKANGMIVEEELIDENILEEPVSAVVKRGTKVIVGEGSGRFAYPVVGGRVSSGYGMRDGRLHKGTDFISSNKTIMAADNGKVVFAGVKSGYGNCIIIDHKNGYQTLYGHLSSISVKAGKIVEKGEKIGVMGNTGDSDGVHLHFEVHVNGGIQNPLKYLKR